MMQKCFLSLLRCLPGNLSIHQIAGFFIKGSEYWENWTHNGLEVSVCTLDRLQHLLSGLDWLEPG